MTSVRLIARLDIKGPNLIKGIQLEGLRVIGDPQAYARKYYAQGADELVYMDIVASLYGRNSLHDIIRRTAQDVFIPLTVGGGLRSVEDVRQILRAGADKVAINTAAVQRPQLVNEIASVFGSQCVVLSIEAKHHALGKWEVYTDNGRERSGLDVIDWAQRGAALGAGELLVTSVDREGTRKGFDCELMRAVSAAVSIPVIASGGMGTVQHLVDVVQQGQADAVAMADILHYERATMAQVRAAATAAQLDVRKFA